MFELAESEVAHCPLQFLGSCLVSEVGVRAPVTLIDEKSSFHTF